MMESAAGSVSENSDNMQNTNGTERASENSLERAIQQVAPKEDGWYARSTSYWARIEPTLDGVLGGYASIHQTDIEGSRRFIEAFLKRGAPRALSGNQRALDCGAGIGRVARHLLCRLFQQVDLLEPNPSFLAEAARQLEGMPAKGQLIQGSLQDYSPTAGHYDVIWLQWVLLYLKDVDLIECLSRCAIALRPGGMIFVKENVSSGEHLVVDSEDASVTRTDQHFRDLFARAGLRLVRQQLQRGFPAELYPVRMYALEPSGLVLPK